MAGLRFLRCMAVSASFVVGLAASPVLAQQPAPLAAAFFNAETPAPDVQSIPVLSNLAKSGGKLFYMGERSGVFGWFVVKAGQIQMIYLTADKKTAFVGGMFTAEGENVTSKQITQVVAKNAELKSLLQGSMRQEKDVLDAGAQQGGATSVPSAPAPAPTAAGGAALPAATISPGERLVADLKAAAGVVLGHNDRAEIQMVVAPGCPNCKKTWQELRDSVKEGKVQVRLIPVYNSTGEREKNIAAMLLKAPDPMAAWDQFVEGDAASLTGTPDPVAVRAVTQNLGLVAKWNIQGYPYLVYRGSDGRIKIVQGRPERMAAVLADVLK